jgi:hypothetical protein
MSGPQFCFGPNRWPAGPPWRVALCLAQQKSNPKLRLLQIAYFFVSTSCQKLEIFVIPSEARNLSFFAPERKRDSSLRSE